MGEGALRLVRRRIWLVASLVAVSSSLFAQSATAAMITVDATADASLDTGTCTLREAITAANTNTASGGTSGECPAGNASPTTDTINFSQAMVDDPDVADRTINLGTFLPDISEQVTIDGCALATNPPTDPCVAVHGQSTATNITQISADDVTLRFLAFGNAAAALSLSTGNSDFTLENSWLVLTLGAASDPIGLGVALNGDGSMVGGPTGGEANVFAHATDTGLVVNGDNNQVLGNLIGVKPNGTTAAGNATGVAVVGPTGVNAASNNLIGGTQPAPGSCTGPCNVIANSGGSGILMQTGAQLADSTTITGNFIGLDQGGALAADNVGIQNANASETTIGGAAAGQRNYISGGVTGINASAQGAPGLEVRNNFIGLTPSGAAPLGPQTAIGIAVDSNAGSPAVIDGNRIAVTGTAWGMFANGSGGTYNGNVIGLGTGNQDLGGGDMGIRAAPLDGATFTGNTFANFSFAGLSLENGDNNVVTSNRFGTDPSGAGDHAGVGNRGISIIDNFGASTGNTIGGTTAASENVISNTIGGPGNPIVVGLGNNDDNTIGRNRGVNNAGIFIDLGADLIGNDDLNAPNNGVDAPQVTSATDDVVAGSGAAANATVLVFRTPDTGDPTDLASFAGEATASAAGAWQTPVNIPNGTRVTALHTDASGDSSELSSSLAATADPPETTITGGPKKRSRLKGRRKKKRVTLTFVSSEPGEGGFQCQIDNRQFVLCESPFSVKLRRGRHTFRVRAFDDASNPDPTLATRSFRIRRARRG